MEKKQKVAPEGEPPLKQFSVCKTNPFGQTNSVFGAAHTPPPFGPSCSPAFGSSMPAFGSSSTPAFGSSSTSFGGSSGFGQKNLKEVEATRTNIQKLLKEIGSSGFGQKPQKLDYREFTYPTNIEKLFKEVAHLGSSDPTMRYQQLEAVGFFDASFQIWKQSFQATPFQRATQLGLGSAPAFGAISLTYSISSRQIITEEDKRFESWFAIAGADYCVIAADFTGDHTNISQLSGKCVMASCGVQANVKNLQKILCAENLVQRHGTTAIAVRTRSDVLLGADTRQTYDNNSYTDDAIKFMECSEKFTVFHSNTIISNIYVTGSTYY